MIKTSDFELWTIWTKRIYGTAIRPYEVPLFPEMDFGLMWCEMTWQPFGHGSCVLIVNGSGTLVNFTFTPCLVGRVYFVLLLLFIFLKNSWCIKLFIPCLFHCSFIVCLLSLVFKLFTCLLGSTLRLHLRKWVMLRLLEGENFSCWNPFFVC